MNERFYWESDMRDYGDGTMLRFRCLIYERGNPDPIATCSDVNIAEDIVSALNTKEEK